MTIFSKKKVIEKYMTLKKRLFLFLKDKKQQYLSVRDYTIIKIKESKEKTIEEYIILRKRFLLFFYNKQQQYFYIQDYLINKIKEFFDSIYFYIIIISAIYYLISISLSHYDPELTRDNIYNFANTIAWIIWASIAIIFSFSTFILQSTADLFSTQYLNKFINNKKEKIFFLILVLLAVISFFIPVFLEGYLALKLLIIILLTAFLFIYILYRDLRKRINPEFTLKKIRQDWIKHLTKVNKTFIKKAKVQNRIFNHKNQEKEFSLDTQYKINLNWNKLTLENIKYLYEIWLRLLSKNEINSFNLSLKYIHDIYLKHLELRSKYFIRSPCILLLTHSFDDENFTNIILEYLQSIGDRIVKEKRKENIYFLLKTYESIINNSLNVEFADKEFDYHKSNPLLSLVLQYYKWFIEKICNSNENDWIFESIKSTSNISNFIVQKTDDYLVLNQINKILKEEDILQGEDYNV